MSVGYGRRWGKRRKHYLSENPLCVMCQEIGRIESATVVDHIVPHKGDYELFWDKDNYQSLCKTCHDSHKQRQEKSGKKVGCEPDGTPTDSQHHWNRG